MHSPEEVCQEYKDVGAISSLLGADHTYKWHIIMKYIAETLEFRLDKFAS